MTFIKNAYCDKGMVNKEIRKFKVPLLERIAQSRTIKVLNFVVMVIIASSILFNMNEYGIFHAPRTGITIADAIVSAVITSIYAQLIEFAYKGIFGDNRHER